MEPDTDKRGTDKLAHFLSCLNIAALGSWLGMFIFRNLYVGAIFGAIVATIVGVIKEIYDSSRPGNHFCKWDLLADIAGAIAGALMIVALIWLCTLIHYLNT